MPAKPAKASGGPDSKRPAPIPWNQSFSGVERPVRQKFTVRRFAFCVVAQILNLLCCRIVICLLTRIIQVLLDELRLAEARSGARAYDPQHGRCQQTG